MVSEGGHLKCLKTADLFIVIAELQLADFVFKLGS